MNAKMDSEHKWMLNLTVEPGSLCFIYLFVLNSWMKGNHQKSRSWVSCTFKI
uniref:Uncharacterized protein n=1 Tax=Anguilla anguilla TaxID=7936 RepID=A0A0E9QG88_ANGAN